MYSNGKKVLLMTDNPDIIKKMEDYLFQRYNLVMESSSDALDALGRIGDNENTYELAILDENMTGLATTSHIFKTIKCQESLSSILYLSTLHEIVNPAYNYEDEVLPYFFDEAYQHDNIDSRIRRINTIYNMIYNSSSMRELSRNTCRALVEFFKVDCSRCILSSFDQDSPSMGIAAANYPDPIIEPYFIRLKGSRDFNELVDYFKPIHIPDIHLDKQTYDEFLDKFSTPFRSALIVPMVVGGKFMGYFAMFTQDISRLFRLSEIDQCSRIIDFAGKIAVQIIFSGANRVKKQVVEEDPEDDL
jgi:hypothetical protein